MADTTVRLMTLMEVADTLRLSPHTVRAFVRKGRLHPVRICRRLLFTHRDVEQLLVGGIQPSRSENIIQRGTVPALEEQ
jgi:excisionase family DNA binding protein